MSNSIVIAMNLAVVVALTALAHVLTGIGPEFAAGVLVGGVLLGLYLRIKLGYWP